MHQTGAYQEEACEHIKYLIGDSWKKMNKEQSMDFPFSRIFIGIAMNVGRMWAKGHTYMEMVMVFKIVKPRRTYC